MLYFPNIVRDDRTLAPLQGVFVSVLDSEGVSADLKDADGDPIANPIVTNALGDASFYVDDADVYTLTYTYGGRTYRKDTDIIGTPEQFIGPAGPAFATFISLATFKAAPVTNKTQVLQDPDIPFGLYYWETQRAPYTADNLYYIKADDVPLSVGAWVRQRSVSVLDFYADPLGVQDSTAAWDAAQEAADFIEVPFGVYKLDNWTLAEGKVFHSQHAKVRPATQTAPAIYGANVNNFQILGTLEILGEYNPTPTFPTLPEMYAYIAARGTLGTAIGIELHVCRNWRIENLILRNLNGSGIKITGGLNYYPRAYGTIVNLEAYWNEVGIETVPDDTSGEYVTIENLIAAQNKTAVICAVGNLNINGGDIVDNEVGIRLPGESAPGVPSVNHAHGIVTGVQINHNFSRNVWASDIINGHSFTGCNFFGDPPSGAPGDLGQGLIVLDNCKGIFFRGGEMSSPVYVFNPAAQNGIVGCWLPHEDVVGPFYEPTADGLAAQAQMIIRGNSTPDGNWRFNGPVDVLVQAHRTTTSAITIAPATPSIVFDTVDVDYRARWTTAMYNNTTGETTIRTTGWYYVETLLRFSAAALVGGFIFLKVNGTFRVIGYAGVGYNEMGCHAATRIKLNQGDVISIAVQLDATTPVLQAGSDFQLMLADF